MGEPKVLIAVPTAEMARRADFYDYLNMMQRPNNCMGTFAHGASPAKNRNIMIQLALDNDCTHVLFIDDDMAVPPDGLLKLLAHDKDIVGGLYLLRNYPHFPLMFDEYWEDGRCQYAFLSPDKTGLQRVVNTGLGFCLIKTEVFKTIGEPWITLGQLDKDGWGDDIHFFNRCRETGFEMYVDCDVRCGHIMSAIISPHLAEDGKWYTLYNTGSVESFQVPQLVPTVEDLDTNIKKLGLDPKNAGTLRKN